MLMPFIGLVICGMEWQVYSDELDDWRTELSRQTQIICIDLMNAVV